jgi:hypothetical protein
MNMLEWQYKIVEIDTDKEIFHGIVKTSINGTIKTAKSKISKLYFSNNTIIGIKISVKKPVLIRV